MSRGLGIEPIVQEVSGPIAVVVALVTQLGDVWFLFTLVALAYWLDAFAPWVGHGLDRERAAVIVALLAGAITLLVTLKPVFGYPRPPGFDVPPTVEGIPAVLAGLYAWMAGAEGYGFPSGHALASTLVYGGLAWGVRVARFRTRVAVAALLVVLVSTSRVLLGVHYVVDVVVGTAVALGYLTVVLRWLDAPGSAFLLAAVLSVVGVGVAGVTRDVAAVVGLTAGLTATWYALGDDLVETPATRPGALSTTALGLLTAAPLLVASIVFHLPAWLVAVTGAAGGALLLALPLVGERIGLAVTGRANRTVDGS